MRKSTLHHPVDVVPETQMRADAECLLAKEMRDLAADNMQMGQIDYLDISLWE